MLSPPHIRRIRLMMIAVSAGGVVGHQIGDRMASRLTS